MLASALRVRDLCALVALVLVLFPGTATAQRICNWNLLRLGQHAHNMPRVAQILESNCDAAAIEEVMPTGSQSGWTDLLQQLGNGWTGQRTAQPVGPGKLPRALRHRLANDDSPMSGLERRRPPPLHRPEQLVLAPAGGGVLAKRDARLPSRRVSRALQRHDGPAPRRGPSPRRRRCVASPAARQRVHRHRGRLQLGAESDCARRPGTSRDAGVCWQRDDRQRRRTRVEEHLRPRAAVVARLVDERDGNPVAVHDRSGRHDVLPDGERSPAGAVGRDVLRACRERGLTLRRDRRRRLERRPSPTPTSEAHAPDRHHSPRSQSRSSGLYRASSLDAISAGASHDSHYASWITHGRTIANRRWHCVHLQPMRQPSA